MSLKKALLVGINYIGTNNQLNGCINDILNVQRILTTQYHYNPNNILILTDYTIYKPTKANIIAAFNWLTSSITAKNFNPSIVNEITTGHFYFHYSGHGTQITENKSKADAICPLDFASVGMLSDQEISQYLTHKIDAQSKLISTIDACHSANCFDLDWTCIPYPLYLGYSFKKISNFPPTNGEVIMLSGCQDNQTSSDLIVNGQDQGALTCTLLNVLAKNNYNISYEELLHQIRSEINTLSKQTPALSFGKKCILTDNYTL